MANPALTPVSAFPTGLDTPDTFNATDSRATIKLSNWLSRFWDAIIEMETIIGVTASIVNTTITFKLANITGGDQAVGRTQTVTMLNKTLTSPVINTPTGIVKGDVGLGNVDNTSDANKPVSSATQTALNLKANIASPTFTGTVTSPLTVQTGALNEAKGADIASATSTAIGAATGNYVNITGTTTITSFDTVQAGTRRFLQFAGALTLTYNATTMILPTAASILTAAGDVAEFISLGSGNWKCVSYTRANGQALAAAVTATYYSKGAVAFTTNTTVTHGLGTTPTKIRVQGYCLTLNGSYWHSSYEGISIISGGTVQNSASHGHTNIIVNGGTPTSDLAINTTTGVNGIWGFNMGSTVTLSAVGATTFTLTVNASGGDTMQGHNVIWECFA